MSDVKMESKTYRKDFLEYEYQARSDVGQVRTNNEDSLIEAPDLGFFGVCDGLGGHAAGEVASGLASSTLTELVEKATGTPEEVLREGIEEANRRILNDQEDSPERSGMGTTVSSLWLMPENSGLGWIGHVGDSRVYLKRGGQFTRQGGGSRWDRLRSGSRAAGEAMAKDEKDVDQALNFGTDGTT